MKNSPAATSQPTGIRRWLPRFSLRTFIVVMGVLGVGLGCVGIYWQRLRQQQQVVAKIEAAGGDVIYDYQFGAGDDLNLDLDVDFATTSHAELPDGRKQRTLQTSSERVVEVETPPGPRILRSMLGDDAFANVEVVSFFDWNSRPPGKLDPEIQLKLPQLKCVLFVGPQVSDDWLNVVARVPQIRIVNLWGDKQGTATAAGVARLRSAHSLEQLRITGDWVRDETLRGVADLHQLKSLDLALVPNVSSALYPNLAELIELRYLSILRAEKVDDQGSEVLRRLKKLHTLVLSNTMTSDTTLAHVRALKDLESLDVSWTKVGDTGMEHIASLPDLQRLNVAGTQVGDAGLAAISRLPKLRYLDQTLAWFT
jgi:hypothetical protein